jgi:hypothetical protein
LQPKNIGVNSTVILNLQVCPWIRLRHGVVTYEVLARFLREYKVVADNIIRFPPSPPQSLHQPKVKWIGDCTSRLPSFLSKG